MQRLLSTPSLESARRTLWFYTGANLVLPVFIALCGMGLFVFYSEQSDLPIHAFHAQLTTEADRLMPRFIVEVLPSGFSGLLLAALLAAAMSSLSSGINSISSVVSSDFVERFGWGGKRTESLWLEKVIAFVAGLVGVGVAIGIMTATRHTEWNLTELTSRVNHIFRGTHCGSFLRRRYFFAERGNGRHCLASRSESLRVFTFVLARNGSASSAVFRSYG